VAAAGYVLYYGLQVDVLCPRAQEAVWPWPCSSWCLV
jgi:hypothetical protein